MTDYIVKTVKGVSKYTPFSENTLRRKYLKDMLAKGFLIKSKFGRARTCTIWGYPDQIKKYFTLLSQKKEIV